MWRVLVVFLCITAAIGTGACGGDDDAVVVTPVLADPVLRTAFDPLVAQNPLAPNPVEITYGSAATGGDTAAVLATADRSAFETLAKLDRLAAAPQTFARTHLVLVTAPGNPKGITSVIDLHRPDVAAALADVDSALGGASALSFAQAKSRAPTAALRVADGAAVVDAVAGGRADAGIVEAPVPAVDVETVTLPDVEQVRLEYAIAPMTPSQAAVGFMSLVHSSAGHDALTAAGFEVPEGG